MPATAIPIQTDVYQNLQAVSWTASDTVNNLAFACTNRQIVLARNTDSVSRTATVISVADPAGFTGSITRSMAAGEVAVLAFPEARRFNQRTGDNAGRTLLQAGTVMVQFAVLEAPFNVIARTP